MFNFSVTINTSGLQKAMQEIIQRKANEIINRRMAPIADEIRKEPQGRFVGTMQGDTLTIKPQGFSPELTEKISELLR